LNRIDNEAKDFLKRKEKIKKLEEEVRFDDI